MFGVRVRISPIIYAYAQREREREREREKSHTSLFSSHLSALFFYLLQCVLSYKVHLDWLISLRSHLHCLVNESHLVDKQVSEDTRAVDDDIDARSAELLERNELDFVDSAQSIWLGSGSDHAQDLRQRLSVRFDVVRSPKNQPDGLWPLAIIFSLLALDESLNDHLCFFFQEIARQLSDHIGDFVAVPYSSSKYTRQGSEREFNI